MAHTGGMDLSATLQLRTLRGEPALTADELMQVLRGQATLTTSTEAQRLALEQARDFAAWTGEGPPAFPYLPGLRGEVRRTWTQRDKPLPPDMWPYVSALDLTERAVQALAPQCTRELSPETRLLNMWARWARDLSGAPHGEARISDLLEGAGRSLDDATLIAMLAWPERAAHWLKLSGAPTPESQQRRRALQWRQPDPSLRELPVLSGRPGRVCAWTPPDPSLDASTLIPSLRDIWADMPPVTPGLSVREQLMATPTPPVPRDGLLSSEATLIATLLCRVPDAAITLMHGSLNMSTQLSAAVLDVISVARRGPRDIAWPFEALARVLGRDRTLKRELRGRRT